MNLVYLGISLPNQIKNPLTTRLREFNSDDLLSVKLSHDEYPLLLDALKQLPYVKEVTLITTCNRFELVLYLSEVNQNNIDELQQVVQSINKSQIDLDVLYDDEAKLQILRTYCGLNSGLVGEDEICMQFEISFKQTYHMGYLGRQGLELLEEAKALRQRIDAKLGLERVSYCEVAINMALNKFNKQEYSNVIVMGSGSTAHQSCLSLINLGFKAENITLLHRISSSSNQVAIIKASPELEAMKYIRTKYGYHTDRVKAIVADADLIVFGIDSRLPSLHFTKHYKTSIIDFSSKPSCSFDEDANLHSYASSSELDNFVRSYSASRIDDQSFANQLKLAENLVSDRVSSYSFKL